MLIFFICLLNFIEYNINKKITFNKALTVYYLFFFNFFFIFTNF
jgi:hypothetical protein